jgi:U3 small nucleolar ribonucleoprotein protein LCP5
MDKLLKNDVDQQLNYRANLDNFDVDANEEEETTKDEDDEEEKPKIYRPPKLVPVEYNDEYDNKKEKGTINKRLEHLQRRAYHSDILEDFKSKYSDAPEEIYNSERSRLSQKNRAYKEKITYEEEYLKRLPQTKHERLQIQRSMMNNGNDIMDHLHDADVLFDENLNGLSKKKKGKMSRRTKKKTEKKKNKSVKRLKSRK